MIILLQKKNFGPNVIYFVLGLSKMHSLCSHLFRRVQQYHKWQFTFCFEPERTVTFFLRPKVDDFIRWKGMPGGVVYGRMLDLCCLYGPETTDSMDIWIKER